MKNIFFFTFMLPCIVIDFFLNNQQDALIIQIYYVIKLYLFRPDSTRKRSSKTCMKLTIAKCTVENSWWAEKIPETCRVL